MSRLLVVSLALVLAACAARSKSGKKASSSDDGEFKEWGSESSESSTSGGSDDGSEYKDPKQEALPEGPSCLDTKGDVQECINDSECCKGFYCGIDPAGSPRIKVCLYGGK